MAASGSKAVRRQSHGLEMPLGLLVEKRMTLLSLRTRGLNGANAFMGANTALVPSPDPKRYCAAWHCHLSCSCNTRGPPYNAVPLWGLEIRTVQDKNVMDFEFALSMFRADVHAVRSTVAERLRAVRCRTGLQKLWTLAIWHGIRYHGPGQDRGRTEGRQPVFRSPRGALWRTCRNSCLRGPRETPVQCSSTKAPSQRSRTPNTSTLHVCRPKPTQ